MTGWFHATFVEPLQLFSFMRYGLVAAAVVGVTAAVLSCLLVVRREALLGDAIAHATLLGVALGYLAAGRVGVFWGALAAGVATGAAIAWVERNSVIKADAAMGILFTFAFAVGLAIISITRPRGIDIAHVLLGNILGVGPRDLALTAVAGGAVLVAVVALFQPLHLWSFDPTTAQAMGVPVRRLQYLFMVLLSATIVASLQAVGLVLVIAMLITPGATALLLTKRLRSMMVVAAGCGLVAGVGGLYGSYHLDVASGPAIVILATVIFAGALAFSPSRGLVVARWRRRRLSRRSAEEDVLKSAAAAELERDEQVSIAALSDTHPQLGEPVEAVVGRLRRRGLLDVDGDRARLTSAGQLEASALVRRHRLLERYLHDAEGMPLDEVHAEADLREHRLNRVDVEAMDRALRHPATDPHGHPIPQAATGLARIAGRPLLDGAPGGRYRVLMVRDEPGDLLAELVAAGLTPDAVVELERIAPGGVALRIGGRELFLRRELAAGIFVIASA